MSVAQGLVELTCHLRQTGRATPTDHSGEATRTAIVIDRLPNGSLTKSDRMHACGYVLWVWVYINIFLYIVYTINICVYQCLLGMYVQ